VPFKLALPAPHWLAGNVLGSALYVVEPVSQQFVPLATVISSVDVPEVDKTAIQ
jgi:hypothetical protein